MLRVAVLAFVLACAHACVDVPNRGSVLDMDARIAYISNAWCGGWGVLASALAQLQITPTAEAPWEILIDTVDRTTSRYPECDKTEDGSFDLCFNLVGLSSLESDTPDENSFALPYQWVTQRITVGWGYVTIRPMQQCPLCGIWLTPETSMEQVSVNPASCQMILVEYPEVHLRGMIINIDKCATQYEVAWAFTDGAGRVISFVGDDVSGGSVYGVKITGGPKTTPLLTLPGDNALSTLSVTTGIYFGPGISGSVNVSGFEISGYSATHLLYAIAGVMAVAYPAPPLVFMVPDSTCVPLSVTGACFILWHQRDRPSLWYSAVTTDWPLLNVTDIMSSTATEYLDLPLGVEDGLDATGNLWLVVILTIIGVMVLAELAECLNARYHPKQT